LEHIFQSQKTQIGCQRAFETDICISLYAGSPPVFSTYTQDKTRGISIVIAVLEHINNQLAEDILEALTDESDLSLVSFDNQVTGVDSMPDAAIKSSTAPWFETKTSQDAVDQTQLESHLYALEGHLGAPGSASSVERERIAMLYVRRD